MLKMIDFAEVKNQTQQLLDDDLKDISTWLAKWSNLAGEMRDAWITYKRGTYLGQEGASANYELLMNDYMPEFEDLQHQLALKAKTLTTQNVEEQSILTKILQEDLLYNKSSGDLGVQIQQTIRQHEALVANHSYDVDGQKVTFQRAQMELRKTSDSTKRHALWQQINLGWEKIYPEIDSIFARLISLRQLAASREGYENFTAQNWVLSERWDHTPKEALSTLDLIAEVFAETHEQIIASKAKRLGVHHLQPWDQEVDTPELYRKESLTQAEMVNAAKVALSSFEPSFVKIVESMEDTGNIDIMTRPGKRNYSAASYFAKTGQTMIYANLAGHIEDMRLLSHEIGHTIHYSYCVSNRPFWFKGSPSEVSECVAYIFQHVCVKNLRNSNLFSGDEFGTFLRLSGENLVESLMRVAHFERFQHWLYEQDAEGLEMSWLDQKFLSLSGYATSESATEIARSWRRRQHLISYPFREGTYALATVAALSFIGQYRAAPKESIQNFKAMMCVGRRASTTEAFAKGGIRFPFTKDDVLRARDCLHKWFDF
jgi:oligoendopeptidase F